MPAQALDEVGATHDDPCLRSAEQLVAGERDEVGAGREALPGERLVGKLDQDAGAQVVDERQPVSARDRRQLRDGWLLREPDDAEVGLVHAQQHGGVGGDRVLVVGCARAIRRSDLGGARRSVRARPECGSRRRSRSARRARRARRVLPQARPARAYRGGVVVDDERGLGAGQPSQKVCGVILARAACPRGQVVLQIRVAARDFVDPRQRGGRERRASEIRVDDHAGCVEDATKPGPSGRAELLAQPFAKVARVGSFLDLVTRAGDHHARRGDRQRVVHSPGELVHGRQVTQPHPERIGGYTRTEMGGSLSEAARRGLPIPRVAGVLATAVLIGAAFAGAFELRDRAYRDEPLPGVHVRARISRRPSTVGERPPDLGAACGAPAARRGCDEPRRARGRARHLPSRVASLLSPVALQRDVRPALALRAGSVRRLTRKFETYSRPPVSARISLNGLTPVVVPAHPGSTVDRWRLLTALKRRAIDGGYGPIVVHFVPTKPRLSTATARQAAVAARTMLSHAITLTYGGAVRGSLQPNKLAGLLRFRVEGRDYVAAFDGVATAAAAHAAVRGSPNLRGMRPLS